MVARTVTGDFTARVVSILCILAGTACAQVRVVASLSEVSLFCGTSNVRIVYRGDIGTGIVAVDLSTSLQTTIDTDVGTLLPSISADGQTVVFARGPSDEGLADVASDVLAIGIDGTYRRLLRNNAFEPRFVQGSSQYVVCTSTDGADVWNTGQTWRLDINNPTSATAIVAGSFVGGMSTNQQYLATAFPTARIYDDAAKTSTAIHWFDLKRIPDTTIVERDTLATSSPSISSSTVRPDVMLYTDEGWQLAATHTIPALPGLGNWGAREILFINGSDNQILRYYRAPAASDFTMQANIDRVAWGHVEWTNHPYFAVASVQVFRTSPASQHHEAAYLINLKDSTYLKILDAQGDTATATPAGNIRWPVAWVEVPGGFVESSDWLGTASGTAGNDTVRVVSPNGGESFTVGETMTIRWTADTTIMNSYGVAFTPDNGVHWFILNQASALPRSQMQFQWTIPETIETMSTISDLCRVRVYDYMNDHFVDMSDSLFSITGSGTSQTVTTITLTPADTVVSTGGTVDYTAVALDQSGTPLTSQPPFTWSVSGGGTISSGTFTAGSTAGGPFTVTATSGGLQGTATVTVVQGAGVAITSPLPDTVRIAVGDTLRLQAGATMSPYTPQIAWLKANTDGTGPTILTGKNTTNFSFPSLTAADEGMYIVRFTYPADTLFDTTIVYVEDVPPDTTLPVQAGLSAFAHATVALTWRPIGYSYVLDDDSVTAVLGAYDPTTWLLYKWHRNQYAAYTGSNGEQFAFTPGALYWLLTRTALTLNNPAGTSTPNSVADTIVVRPEDWADFTLPFTYDSGVAFSDIVQATLTANPGVTASDIPLWTWEGGTFTAVTEGASVPADAVCGLQKPYFVYNRSASKVISLIIPPEPATGVAKRARRPREHEWYASIDISDEANTMVARLLVGNSGESALAGRIGYPLPQSPAAPVITAGLAVDGDRPVYSQVFDNDTPWRGSAYRLVVTNNDTLQHTVSAGLHHLRSLAGDRLVAVFDHGRSRWSSAEAFGGALQAGESRAFTVVAGSAVHVAAFAAQVSGPPTPSVLHQGTRHVFDIAHPLYNRLEIDIYRLDGTRVFTARARGTVVWESRGVAAGTYVAVVRCLDSRTGRTVTSQCIRLNPVH